MVAVPYERPVTLPVGLTLAVPDGVLQVPPGVVHANVMVLVMQTFVGPVIGATVGNGFTVITLVAATVPQLFVTV